MDPLTFSKFLGPFNETFVTSSIDSELSSSLILNYRLQVHSATQTANATPLTRNSAAGNNPISVASAVCAWLNWEREPPVVTPVFLICSEEPRTCRTTAKRDWCAGRLGKMLLLHRAAQKKFQKIFRPRVVFGLRFHL